MNIDFGQLACLVVIGVVLGVIIEELSQRELQHWPKDCCDCKRSGRGAELNAAGQCQVCAEYTQEELALAAEEAALIKAGKVCRCGWPTADLTDAGLCIFCAQDADTPDSADWDLPRCWGCGKGTAVNSESLCVKCQPLFTRIRAEQYAAD